MITLVHGTWARGSVWPVLDAAIKAQWAGKAQVSRFEWSGRNWAVARAKGAEALRSYLRRQLKSFPKARHFVVGHSHGGTVAMMALSDANLARRIDGVACLSTPFIHVKPRDQGFFGRNPENNQMFAGLLGLVALAVAYFRNWTFGQFLLAFTALGLVFGLMEFLRSKSEDILKWTALPRLSHTSVLVLRGPADEASSALTFLQFLIWLSDRAVRLVGSTIVSETVAGLAAWAVGIYSWYFLGVSWQYAVGYGLLTAFVIGGAAYAIAAPLILLAMGASIVYGPELAAAAIFLDVSIEALPPGRASVYQLRASGAQDSLAHSMTYSDQEPVSVLVSWLRETAGRPSKP